MRCLSVRRKKLCRGAIVGLRTFAAAPSSAPVLFATGESLAETLSLIVSEHAVALVPDYVRQIPAQGVTVRPIVDAGATWDFLAVWQRGRIPRRFARSLAYGPRSEQRRKGAESKLVR